MDERTPDPIEILKDKLVKMQLLSQSSADIYGVGLRHGTVTSSDVAAELDVRASTASNRLQKLVKDGYFERTPREGEPKKSGKGHAIRYRVVPAEQALQKIIADSKDLAKAADMATAPYELQAEQASDHGDMWLAEAEHLVFAKGIEKITGARKTVQISSRDCSWLDDGQVTEAIAKATKNNVKVRIAASEIPTGFKQTIRRLGASYVKTPFSGPTFCIVDRSTLLIPFRPRTLREGYHLLVTTHKYLVSEFIRYFESLSSMSRK
jgi:predicted transcriptional regulator